jgi:hypothetical protein
MDYFIQDKWEMTKIESMKDIELYISYGIYQKTLIPQTPYIKCKDLEYAEKEFNRGLSLYIKKDTIISEAKKQGIIDINTIPGNTSIDTIKLASNLMKKHGDTIYKKLEEKRKKYG